MTQRLLTVTDLSLSFPHKTCFEGFNAQIHAGERIGIVGQNGSGKTHLLKLLRERLPPEEVGYVAQILNTDETLSGAGRFNKALSSALATNPSVLLLDEPTNHLDSANRASLMRMLQGFVGTIVVVSHDVELLSRCITTVWHLADRSVEVFASFEEYTAQTTQKRRKLEDRLDALKDDRRQVHRTLMRDQERAKKRRVQGEKKYDGDKLALRSAQGRGELTTNKNRKRIAQDKGEVLQQLHDLRIPEVMKPRFHLVAGHARGRNPLVRVRNGSCGYDHPVLSDLHFQLGAGQRIRVSGKNGSGKTTFIRAIMGDSRVIRGGIWMTPPLCEVGYLDQHYANLAPTRNAFETIAEAAPHMIRDEIRDHLNAFLLRKNEEVFLESQHLSGGEKARLSLAQIAARMPSLLILDELTNNLDLETREHVIQVLKEFPGALLVVTHDDEFAKQISLEESPIISESVNHPI